MPYSDGSLRPWIGERIFRAYPDPEKRRLRVVDVGAGAAMNLSYFQPLLPESHWTAIEIWEPYIRQFQLEERYDVVIDRDVREMTLPPADLYILGDVLEHMLKDEAIELWNRCRERSRYVVASLPIVHYPQGAEHGNPYEEHLYHWSREEFLDSFPGVVDHDYGSVVGAFWAKGLTG